MAATSVPTSKFDGLKISDPLCLIDGSVESKFHTIHAFESACATTSSLSLASMVGESVVASSERGKRTITSEQEDQIERSKEHWSEVSEAAFNLDEQGVAEKENREVFKKLQQHPRWGRFFITFGYSLGTPVPGRPGFIYGSMGELEVGEKFAEGGQAQLFHTKVILRNPKHNENSCKDGVEYVLKVFKKGTLLHHLQSQWPLGYLEWWANYNEQDNIIGKSTSHRFHCFVQYATLLEDGRFAFLMVKEDEDLRNVIHRNMQTNSDTNHGPFQKDSEEPEMIMYHIALGMDWLHTRNIVHRDLKASNVLMRKGRLYGKWMCFVADFECSVGVVGTGFWRAPEILQAIKDKKVFERSEVFSKEADVYAYGMTCYEILTGKIPFEGHSWRDYDLVLSGNRPEVAEYVDDWARGLLEWCWHSNPRERPSFRNILDILEANSGRVRRAKLDWGI